MSSSEKVFGIVRDMVLPADARMRYDVYFTDRRVAIVCMGRADRFESETEEPFSLMPSVFGVPPPMGSQPEKAEGKPSIDQEVEGWSLDQILKLSKKSCFYTNEEIEEVRLIFGRTLKFVILSSDCESKFSPDEEQFKQLSEILPTVEPLRNKLWIAGKWNMLFGMGFMSFLCKFCGYRNSSDAVYCQRCGKKIREETAEVQS